MANLPADLPENWTQGQTISPNGTEVGLTEQHGYNYLMKQVNATQTEVNNIATEIGTALAGVAQETSVQEMINVIGETGDTGGSSTEGTLMGKVNALVNRSENSGKVLVPSDNVKKSYVPSETPLTLTYTSGSVTWIGIFCPKHSGVIRVNITAEQTVGKTAFYLLFLGRNHTYVDSYERILIFKNSGFPEYGDIVSEDSAGVGLRELTYGTPVSSGTLKTTCILYPVQQNNIYWISLYATLDNTFNISDLSISYDEVDGDTL